MEESRYRAVIQSSSMSKNVPLLVLGDLRGRGRGREGRRFGDEPWWGLNRLLPLLLVLKFVPFSLQMS
jgi:hypothetical protein